MASSENDLGDANSRTENVRFRDLAERQKSTDPAYAYVPRWVPTGNWRLSAGDLIVILFGVALLLMVLGMRLFGIIH